MLSSDLPRVLLLLTAVELSWGSLSDEDERMILQMHNLYRSQVSPPAADMQKLSWDPDLGTFAKAYAEKCIWDHNKDRGRRGENLFIMMEELDLQLAMEDWHSEYQYYNLTTTKCATGRMCGHYTQVVWANTLRIGCGAHFCETVEGIEERDMHLLVCNYEPPGNIRGRKPYREGSPCSLCPEDYKCINSMCEPSVDSEETTIPTMTTKPSPTTIAKLAPTTTIRTRTSATGRARTTTKPALTTRSPTPTTVPIPASTTTLTPTTTPKPTTVTKPVPTTTTKTSPAPPTTIRSTPSTMARPSPTTEAELTSSIEPTLDLDIESSPEMQVYSEEATEALPLDLDPTFSPNATPEVNGERKEVSLRAEQAVPSDPPPSLELISSEADLSLEEAKQIVTTLKPVPSNPKAPTLLRLMSSSKDLTFQSLSGAKETEDISPDLTHKDGHQPKTSSASNILELSFLLLASSLLRALLL
ncbi:peptidase inhibitor 16 isoform X1 [Alligator mississippiensis]|nr:peptidase inhibitor 16 isoform X1 [Alligator mississippiensis]